MKQNKLQDFSINVRIKLAGLWTSVMFCYVYGDYFELYVPGKTEGLISGDNLLNEPLKLAAASVLMAIPALLISVSLMVKPALSRTLSIVFGIFYTLIMLLIASMSFSLWNSFYVFLALLESLLTALIAFTAWQWPREPEAKE